MIKEYLNQVISGVELTKAQAYQAIKIIAENEVPPAQVGALLGALRTKGESGNEISGFASYLLEKSIPVPTTRTDLIDCCGTGGDGAKTFNISTAVAIVLAASGLGMAKHGNRSVSSKSGSADVLEELGVAIDLSPEKAGESLDKTGFAFLFAPLYHPAFKNIVPIRKSMGIRTIFNIMGPLVNPAQVKKQVIGVFDPSYTGIMAHALKNLGTDEAMVVSSNDGLDEISISAATQVAHLKDGKVTVNTIRPNDVGISEGKVEDLKGGEAKENAGIIEGILKAEIKDAKRDIVVINTAANLLVGGKAQSLKEGVELASHLLDSGKAYGALENIRNFK
jgi:anthranilate phosphoribosyltransferase